MHRERRRLSLLTIEFRCRWSDFDSVSYNSGQFALGLFRGIGGGVPREAFYELRGAKGGCNAVVANYFAVALSTEMYLAISMLTPAATNSQTAAMATKPMIAPVDLISCFLRISAASASSRHSASTSGGMIL